MWKLKYYLKTLLISLILGIPCVVGGNILSKKGDEYCVLSWVIYFLLICIVATLFSVTHDKLKSICDSCHKSLKGGEYTYEIEEAKDYNYKGKHRVNYKYLVNCTCPNCGANKEFTIIIGCKASENPDVKFRKTIKKYYLGH